MHGGFNVKKERAEEGTVKLQDRNLSEGMQGEDVALLHRELSQLRAAGLLDVKFDPEEVAGQRFGTTTGVAVRTFQNHYGLEVTAIVDETTAERINAEVDALRPYRIDGHVVSRSRAGVDRLRVEIVDKMVGDDVPLAKTLTDEDGAYHVTFTDANLRQRGKTQPDLQARVFADDTFLAASDVRYNASKRETLDVRLDEKTSSALRSEHETLTDNLSAHFKGKLGDLKEKDGRQDITYLANKTGWDARAVAMAALADQFSARTTDGNGGTGIEPTFFYALFRAGLPAKEDALYQISHKTAETAWKQAIAQGVIPAVLESHIPVATERFRELAAQRLLEAPALVGVSSLKEIASISLGSKDTARQRKFADLYTRYRDDLPRFWAAVQEAFDDATEKRLRLDGKLAYLTLNNAPLIRKLHSAAGQGGLSDTLKLVEEGYYRAEKWHEAVGDDPIPPEIPGTDESEKRSRYAEVLAAQVRLSYPTAVVAQMVKSGETPLNEGTQNEVHAFLMEHHEKFEIGQIPVAQYVARNNLHVSPQVTQAIARIERVYQITRGDGAMNALLKREVDSAYAVVRYDKETFVRSFSADLGGEDEAALTYDRAVQVHHVILNIALGYLNARTSPAIGAHSAPHVLDPTPALAADVIAGATLEKLFGSMDFCPCEHCRSILSPAAYLVDLLLFLDHPDPPTGTENPQTVLLERRPDIQHLPLTCENTNTALPYIDVVNETLEYYVANDVHKLTLEKYAGHDTGTVVSEDLLASPQFVMDAAYTTLRGERYPLPLPFHQPLESLRRYFAKFEVPLSLAMERLRKTDDLERGTTPYGWRDILMEEIGLSRDEHEILTDSNAVPLWRLYGYPSGTADAVVAGLSNATQFARRVGITYEDLVSVLRTRFVNPHSDLIPKLERLGVSIGVLKALKDGTDPNFTDQDFDDLLPADLTAPDPSEYGGDIKAWVKDNDNYTRIMGLITLAIPADIWTPSTAYAHGDLVRPIDPAPTSTLYYECTKAGTSGTQEPDWPMVPGKTYDHDNAVHWTCRDAASCFSFDNLALRYSDPSKLTQDIGAVEFVRLMRFIRLWKKLGWTIEQTDAAICALYRVDLAPIDGGDLETVTKLDAGFLTLLPRLGIAKRVMRALNLTPKRDLLPLLACWSEIDTHGDNALYRQMFLNPTVLAQDAVFADKGYGTFLQHADVPYTHSQATLEQAILAAAAGNAGKIGYNDSTQRLSYAGVLDTNTRDALKAVSGVSPGFQQAVDALFAEQRLDTHAEALRAAFNLTGDEYEQIVAALDYDADTALNLANISAMYRHGWLARKLKISVRELLLLVQLAGLDPSVLPDPTEPAILRLASLIQSLKDRSLKSAATLYLIWNQDLSGKSAPDPAQLASFARTLRLGFAAVEAEFAVADDPDGTIAQGQMAKVYGSDAATFFFGLLNDTLTVEVEFSDPDGTLSPGLTRQAIENAAGTTDAGVPRIAYDDFLKRLSYSGVLATATRDAIKLAAGVGAAAFNNAVDDLYNENQAVINPFFARYPELESPYDAYIADTTPTHSVAKKRGELLKTILPELIRRQKRQQVLQSVSAVAKTDLAFAQAFLDPPAAPFPLHAVGHNDRPAVNDLLALETAGLSVRFFSNDTAGGPPISNVPEIAANLDYAPPNGESDNPLPANPTPGASISGIWRGHLEAPENGFFNLRVEADIGATVTIQLDDKHIALTQTLAQTATMWENAERLELRAGTLYPLSLTVETVRDDLHVQWEWEPRGQGREIIPPRYLYPATSFERFQDIYVRFLKAASLATGLGLTTSELAHIAVQPAYRITALGQLDSTGQNWLNALPNADNLHLLDPGDAAIASNLNAALLAPLRAILDFARIKAAISPRDESLLDVLRDPTMATQNPNGLLFTITRWNQPALNEVVALFGGNVAGLNDFELFEKVYDALTLMQKLGVSAKALIEATGNEPTGETIRKFQAALRARYDADSWRDVVRPINDEMRSLQRDALVAYILHQMRAYPESAHIDTPEKLFEYFLMDVQMAPCMQTSRVRHALSSIQLFIERCLMNLEPRVSPTAITARQWEWMKRYRVWEANRKVFLWPENWLEPELRDDQSPFFKETMSELLQSDITDDRAATALLNYLSKLEEVAKLEPCGIHHVEDDPNDPNNRTGKVDHVVARTAGANRKYYYRRREGSSWTPWEQIKLNIEDNPVIPVVWKGRLFLFWLRILKEAVPAPPNVPNVDSLAEANPADIIPTDEPLIRVKAMLCWSEYYNGKWQAAKTSDVNLPTLIDTLSSYDVNALDLHLGVSAEGPALRVYINEHPYGVLGGFDILKHNETKINWPGSFLLYNTHSLPIPGGGEEQRYIKPASLQRDSVGDYKSDLSFKYTDLQNQSFTRDVLQATLQLQLVSPRHDIGDSWRAPFLLDDRRHVFYVTTETESMAVQDYGDVCAVATIAEASSSGVAGLEFNETKYPGKIPRPDPSVSSTSGGATQSAIQRLVTEDGHINIAIGTTGTIAYDGVQIGIRGKF